MYLDRVEVLQSVKVEEVQLLEHGTQNQYSRIYMKLKLLSVSLRFAHNNYPAVNSNEVKSLQPATQVSNISTHSLLTVL